MRNSATIQRQQLRSVLVVDSDPDVLAVVTAILEGPGTGAAVKPKAKMRVLRARNLTEAMDVLGRAYVPVDLVLSNSDLPQGEAGNIAERIREVRPQLPVLYMSAGGSETIRIHGLKQDRSGVPGGIDGQELLTAVAAALDAPQPARAAAVQ